MSEAGKTCVFVAVGLVALGVAYLSRPTAPPTAIEDLVGTKSLNVVEDPLATQDLEIIRWDSATGDPVTFQVARQDGVWKIPSHGDYPADADRQIGDATSAAANLKPLGIVSDKQADHSTYGVIDPESAKPGESGVGTRVVMKDGKGETLVSTIIGKEVKDQPGQHYVRQVGKDVVYIVKVDPDKLSTKFEDWIEKDLLKLNTLDISQVKINDYSVNIAQTQGGLGLVDERRGEMLLSYNDTQNEWALDELLRWDETEQKLVEDSIPEGEELNQVKLNDMKSALADLKIVDVQRKPAGMGADLKAEKDFIRNQQAVQNLMSRGFYAVRGPNESIEILSSEGDFIVGLNDGVEYVLRFGGIKVGANTQGEQEETAEGEEAEPKGENRFLFVAARYNPDVIPKPERPAILAEDSDPAAEPAAEEKSETPADGETPSEDAPPADETPAEKKGPATEEKPAEEEKPVVEETPETTSLTPDQEDGAAVDQPAPTDNPAKETPAEEAAKRESKSEEPEAESTESEKSEPSEKEDAPAEESAPAEDSEKKPADEQPSEEAAEPQDDAAQAKEAAELEYNRAMDEYNDKVEKAQTRVTELNERFGDWYYVISDEVFRKIHITREDLFKKKEAEKKEPGAAPAAEQMPKSSIPLDAPANIEGE